MTSPLAHTWSLQRLYGFGDSKLVEWLQGFFQNRTVELNDIIGEAKRAISQFQLVYLHHTMRENNIVADELSERVVDSSGSSISLITEAQRWVTTPQHLRSTIVIPNYCLIY